MTSEDQESGVDLAAGVPFESLFTLPFALHLRPLPHVSFLAEQDSGQSSDQDDEGDVDRGSTSSKSSNYRAGNHRLSPHTNTVPPHSLKTISMLLEQTGCLDAVSTWSEVLEMIDAADEDPHFSNLRAFFDARFDNNGRLIGGPKDNGKSSSSLRRNSSRRTASVSRDDVRHNASGKSGNPLSKFAMRQNSKQYEEEATAAADGASGSIDGRASKHERSPPLQLHAPEVIVVSKDGSEARRVPFKVRLDLHNIGLAPPPPRPPVVTRASARSTIAKRLSASPTKKSIDGHELQRVLSTSSAEQSHAENLSLHPVRSPDSFRSKVFSDGSDDLSIGRRGSDALSASPRSKGKKFSRSSTTSSAVAPNTAITSEFGTSPDSMDGSKVRQGFFGSFSAKGGDGERRPSMIQRLMDFKGLRSNSGRSKDSMSVQSQDRIEEEKGVGAGLARMTSAEHSGFSSTPGVLRERSNTLVSDLSNEDALDVGDDDGSVFSSSHPPAHPMGIATSAKRRTSSSGGPTSNSMMGFRPAPDMQTVQEGAVYSAASSEGDEEEMAVGRSDDGHAKFSQSGEDFFTLLRRAANTSLMLRKVSHAAVRSPARTPKGSRSAGSAQTPPGSVELEDQERAEAMLAPFKQADSSWWLSGSVDPLPVSIACALSQALGWNGMMDLCYGRSSRGARAGSYQPLGRAAEMDRKLRDEKSRVQDWAQGVAGGTLPSGIAPQGGAVPTSVDAAEVEAREKLSSVKLSTDAGSDQVAPSESASAQNFRSNENAEDRIAKISSWIRKKSGLQNFTALAGSAAEGEGNAQDRKGSKNLFANASPFSGQEKDHRTWQDWAELTRSIADWLQEYETTRVRNSMAGEIGHEVESKVYASHPDSGFLETNFDAGIGMGAGGPFSSAKLRYASRGSYQVPYCVVKDALNKHNSFRRRHGIPEGLPVGPDGQEMGEYRWARKHLSPNHFATSTTLAVSSLAYFMQQLAVADWTHESAWELDYLEMCVFRSPVVARRFPSPGSQIVPSSQSFSPAQDDEEARKRATPCPYPSIEGAWSSSNWLEWLRSVKKGNIIVPAVSWQAWWTLIAVLNGGDGSDRALDVQLKAEEESFDALEDMDAVFI